MINMQSEGYKKKTNRAVALWVKWEHLLSTGEMTIEEIASKYKHRKGKFKGKPYARSYIYQAMKKLHKYRMSLLPFNKPEYAT